MRRKAILVAGMPGAGKRTAIEAMASGRIPVFRMGDVVREEASRMGVEPTPEGLGCLKRLKHLLRVRMIRDAAREAMMRSISGNTLTIHLNRHAAYAGKASFTEPYGECPLGPITITVECENPEEVVEWLTEKEG